MKHFTFIITILFMFFACCAVFAEDTHFTCSSVPADFDGQTFENLYLDVEGCGTVEFSDLTVTGNLIYDGGRDTEDHYITFNRPSIESMYAPCEPTHECHFIFNPDQDTDAEVTYVVKEMTLLPSGNEKGKIFVQGSGSKTLEKDMGRHHYTNHQRLTAIKRINFILGEWNQDVISSLADVSNVPSSMPNYLSAANNDVEIDLGNILVMEMSVVNMSDNITSSISMREWSKIQLLSSFTKSLKMYEPEQTAEYKSSVDAYITSIDGDSLKLSLDHIAVSIAHVLGNNNSESILNLYEGYEQMHDDNKLITNLFLFGSNMNIAGYGTPDRDTMNLTRLVVTEQPSEYELKPTPSILNEFIASYGNGYNPSPEEYIDSNEYERYLDIQYAFQHPEIRLLTDLSQQYAVNYPDSDTHWKPVITLSSVNVGKAICAKSIADEVPALDMFKFKTDSIMYFHHDVMRYVMPEGLTETLAEEPSIYTGFEPLPGCHTYGLDQYGNWVVKD